MSLTAAMGSDPVANELRGLLSHNAALREHWQSVSYIKDCLAREDWCGAAQAYAEIPREAQLALWRAPSKGGIWTTAERAVLLSPESISALRDR